MNEINEYNRRVHENLNLLWQGRFETCMFSDGCTEPVIQAHSVSRSVLSKLEDNGHVVQAMLRTGHDEVGRSYPKLIFEPIGINRASTGTFVCRTHDAKFTDIDTVPMDFDDPRTCDLLFFRALMKEAWLLFKAQVATMWFERTQPWPTSLPNHPNTRLRALLNATRRMRPWLDSTSGDSVDRPVIHVIRRLKTDHAIVAASSAGGGQALSFDDRTGRELPAPTVRTLTGTEPNSCWSFSVIPQATEHVMVASWLRNSPAYAYFQHFNEVQGRELQEAVSAELILLCENWFLNPKVWESFSSAKQAAITDAYDNTRELLSGQYSWHDRPDDTPWFEYLNLSNRRQINLFRYNKTVF